MNKHLVIEHLAIYIHTTSCPCTKAKPNRVHSARLIPTYAAHLIPFHGTGAAALACCAPSLLPLPGYFGWLEWNKEVMANRHTVSAYIVGD